MVLNWKQQQHFQQLEQQQLQNTYSKNIPVQWQQAGEAGAEPELEVTPPASPPPDDSDLARVQAALNKERELRNNFEKQFKTLQKQMEAFSGIDPEKAKQAEEILRKQQQYEEEQAKLEASLSDKFKQEYEPQLHEERTQKAQVQQDFIDFQRDAWLERAYLENDGFPNEFMMIAPELRSRVRFDASYAELRDLMKSNPAAINQKIQVLDAAGKPAYVSEKGEPRPMTLTELIADMKKNNLGFARHFKSNERGGLQITGNNPYGHPNWENLDHWEKLRIHREKQFASGR